MGTVSYTFGDGGSSAFSDVLKSIVKQSFTRFIEVIVSETSFRVKTHF